MIIVPEGVIPNLIDRTTSYDAVEAVFGAMARGDAYNFPVIREDIVLSGETNLMDFQDLSNMNKLRDLFDAFNEKQGIIHLLDRCMDAEGVQIFIGEESGYDALDGCSLVTAPYAVDDEKVGVLGVIGPTRMEYCKVIPVVDVTAKILSSALKS